MTFGDYFAKKAKSGALHVLYQTTQDSMQLIIINITPYCGTTSKTGGDVSEQFIETKIDAGPIKDMFSFCFDKLEKI